MTDLSLDLKNSIADLQTRHAALITAVQTYRNGSVGASKAEITAAIAALEARLNAEESTLLGLAGRGVQPSLCLDFMKDMYLMGENRPTKGYNFADLVTFTRSSTGMYFNSAGVLKQAEANVPRFDYDPVTKIAKGLLIEESRTNLLTRSNNPGLWNNAQLQGTPNGAIGLDGNMSGFLTGSVAGPGQQNISIPADTTSYSVSIYVRPAVPDVGKAIFTLMGINGVAGSSNGGTNAHYDFATGTFGSGMSGFTATPHGQFTKLTRVFTNNGSGVTFISRMDNDPNAQIVLGGIQIETGAFATSYIPTTTSQVTRTADSVMVNTLSPWFNPTEGTLSVSYDQIAGVGDNAYAAVFSPIVAGSYVAINGTAGAQTGWHSNGTGKPRLSTGVLHKQAMTYNSTNKYFASVADGGTIYKSSLSDYLGLSSKLSAGSREAGSQLNGHVRRLQYYPRGFNDTELQELTSW